VPKVYRNIPGLCALNNTRILFIKFIEFYRKIRFNSFGMKKNGTTAVQLPNAPERLGHVLIKAATLPVEALTGNG
jgi:hypothetical protein